MIKTKATTLVFLIFTIVVAIVNISYGNYEHIFFCIPFLIAMIEQGKKYRVYEIIGLYIASIYLSIFLDNTTGTMALVISSCFLFTYSTNKKFSRLSIYITSFLVFVISLFSKCETKNIIIHSFLDMAFYSACATSIYFAVYRCIEENKAPDKPLEKEYFELLDKLNSLAHESINMLKNARGNK